ncbi:unnamed protein product [Ectocarpus fasciculatus]
MQTWKNCASGFEDTLLGRPFLCSPSLLWRRWLAWTLYSESEYSSVGGLGLPAPSARREYARYCYCYCRACRHCRHNVYSCYLSGWCQGGFVIGVQGMSVNRGSTAVPGEVNMKLGKYCCTYLASFWIGFWFSAAMPAGTNPVAVPLNSLSLSPSWIRNATRRWLVVFRSVEALWDPCSSCRRTTLLKGGVLSWYSRAPRHVFHVGTFFRSWVRVPAN